MAPLRVRRYRPRDRERLRELHAAALREAGTDPADVPGTEDLGAIEATYLRGGEFVVGERDGEVVAMGGLERLDDATGEIKRMRVDPDHQGRGYGTAVLEALEGAARDRGFERIVLETAARQGSAGFYRERGYQGTGRRSYGDYELIAFEKVL